MSYTDSTPPSAFSGSLTTAIAGETGETFDKIAYSVYSDTSTWNSWTDWASNNALDYQNTKDFSSRAIQITAYWPTILPTDDTDD